VRKCQEEFLNLRDVVFEETPYPRTPADLDAAVLKHRDWFVNLARRALEYRGWLMDDYPIIPDVDDDFRNGGEMWYQDGVLEVTFRNCEDDWSHTVKIPVEEEEIIPESWR